MRKYPKITALYMKTDLDDLKMCIINSRKITKNVFF